jgi:hypothetical protein
MTRSDHFSAAAARLRKLVKEEIDRGNLTVPGDDEIGSGVSWRLAMAAGNPTDTTSIAHLLRRRDRLISEVRMRSLDHPGNAVDLVAAAANAAFGVVENSVFVEDIIDCCASTAGISPNTSVRLRSNKVDTL